MSEERTKEFKEFTVEMNDEQYADFKAQAGQHYRNMEIAALKQAESTQKAAEQAARAVDAQLSANAKVASLRDMFAQSALNGLLASGKWDNVGPGFDDYIAAHAYNIADAMLRAMGGDDG